MGTDRLRIALVTDFFPPAIGGVETQVSGLANALRSAGHDVRVLTASSGATDSGVEVLPFRFLPRTRVTRPTPANYRFLRERIAAGGFDVVHAHGMFSTLAMGGVLAAHGLGLPSVMTHHSLIDPVRLPFARVFYGIASKHATIITAVSDAAAKDARRASGRREVIVVPNGIAVDAREWPQPRVEPHPIRVISVLRLKLKKRPYHLVWDLARVAARLRDRQSVRFRIVGDGPERHRVERLARWLGLRELVEFSGAASAEGVAEALAEADLFVSPTRAEAFGLALLEARAAGLPIVAMDGGGVGEVFEAGRHGLLSASRSQFVTDIARLIEDDACRRALAEASRAGLEKFSWMSVASAYVDVYRRALDLEGRNANRRNRRTA